MRRALISCLLVLAACSTPVVRLAPVYEAGDVRTYALEASATTSVDLSGQRQVQRTTLRARSRVEVLSASAGGATLRLTLTPTGFERDGEGAPPPAEQVAELDVDPAGAVTRVRSVGGVPASIVGADVEDLAPVLGSPLPSRAVRLGDRWRTAIAPPEELPDLRPGTQTGRVSAYRVVRDFDCAVLTLATRRGLVRERPVGEQTVRLAGTETSATEIAFAFRRGFPVEIRTVAEGRFAVGSGSFTGGTVTIESVTELALLDA